MQVPNADLMDEFISIITTYTVIKPTTVSARNADLEGSLEGLKKRQPEKYARLQQLLLKDVLNPFPETKISKDALERYEKRVSAQPHHDDFCESLMYEQAIKDFGDPNELWKSTMEDLWDEFYEEQYAELEREREEENSASSEVEH